MVIYDLKSFLVKIYQKWTFMEEAKIILNAKRSITGSVATVDDGDLINHYGMILAHLATLFLKSWKKLYPSILDSKEIIQSILKKEISNVKIIIHFICAACRKPVITIWKTPRFFIQTQYSLDEMIVGANGPLLHHAYETYEILDSAMNKYWRIVNRDGKGHFLHLTEDIRSYTGNCSKDVDSC